MKNQAELLTLQSRRILLKRSETVPGVVGYEVLGGDYWNSENAFGGADDPLAQNIEGKRKGDLRTAAA